MASDFTLGKNSYRKPPSRDPSDPYGKCYDACVNDITNPTIYVIFNSSQCYPEYIVEYTNKPREMWSNLLWIMVLVLLSQFLMINVWQLSVFTITTIILLKVFYLAYCTFLTNVSPIIRNRSCYDLVWTKSRTLGRLKWESAVAKS